MAIPTILKKRLVKWVGGGTIGIATTLAVSQLTTSEGFSPVVYKDPVGLKTYCYGETSNPIPGKVYSQEYCQFLLSHRAGEFIRQVRALVPQTVFLSPQELAAWGSFTYNVGISTFKSSTAFKLLKAGRRHAACRQLPRWVYGRDRRTGQSIKLKGLVIRRNTEKALCEQGASGGDV